MDDGVAGRSVNGKAEVAMMADRAEVIAKSAARWPWVRLAMGAVLLCALSGGSARCFGQVAPASQPGVGHPGFGAEAPGAPEPLGSSNQRRLEHMREDDRHKRLVADTARLVELTNELKAELEKATKDELSLDVVRKAAEIEKLARDVKERMKS